MFQSMPNINPPLKVTFLVNRTRITMETDTGASTSLINPETFSKVLGNASKLTSHQAELVDTRVKLSDT